MFKQLKKHPYQFALLFIILLSALFFFFYFSPDDHNQRRVVYLTAAAYFLWSLNFHYRKGDLAVSLMLEYLLMALLGLILASATFI